MINLVTAPYIVKERQQDFLRENARNPIEDDSYERTSRAGKFGEIKFVFGKILLEFGRRLMAAYRGPKQSKRLSL